MTEKARLKFGIFVIGVFVTVPISVMAVSLMAQFITHFQQGADPASIFRGHTLTLPGPDQARWEAFGADIAWQPSRPEQEEIITAYWLAWEALNRAYETGDISDLATYWSGAAYEHAIMAIDPQDRFMQTHSGHVLHLTFFSDDASLVVFSDPEFMLTRLLKNVSVSLRASADVIMTLDNGFWRVRSITLDYY